MKHTKTTQFGLSVLNGEETSLNSTFFWISELAHKQSVLDFVDKQHSINKLALNI